MTKRPLPRGARRATILRRGSDAGYGVALDVGAVVMAFWLSAGATPAQAGALVEQARVESGLRPCVRSRTGAWLYGWVGSRRVALAEAAGTAGCPPLEAQLEFARRELSGAPYSAFWREPPGTCLRELNRCFAHGRCGRRR